MKKILAILLMTAMLISVAACKNKSEKNDLPEDQETQLTNENIESPEVPESLEAGDDQEGADGEDEPGSNILVAYFSRVGNTHWKDGVDAVTSASLNVRGSEYAGNAQLLAEMAQQVTEGDLFLVKTEDKYPSDYTATTDLVRVQQSADARPALRSHVENMEAYDTVILVYPIWWGHLPQPMFTFLEEYDFSDKKILPICTHGGSYLGQSITDIMELCPGATVLVGLAVDADDAANAQDEVEEWISNAGIV